MQGFRFQPDAIHVVRVDVGEDVLNSLAAYVKEAGIKQAVVMGGYGTLAVYSLHWVTHNRLPTENHFATGEGGIEILAMNGLVVDGEPHVHVALATEAGGFGGHMEPGCKAYVICEIFLAEVSGGILQRESIALDIAGMGKGMTSRLTMRKE